MKQLFTIAVNIDTEREGISVVESQDGPGLRLHYLVTISKDGPGLENKAHILAHEFGHIINWVFRTPYAHYSIADGSVEKFIQEREAWEAAERMFDFNITKERALRTYQASDPRYFVPSFKLLGEE